jgi:hypothetical protein
MSDTQPIGPVASTGSDAVVPMSVWRRPYFRNAVLGAMLIAILAVVLVAFLVINNRNKAQQVDVEQGKKQTAINQAVANCQAIKRLGGICPADADEIRRGEPPPPPYTDDQVRKIVNDALVQFKRDNPDAIGINESKVLEIVAAYVMAHPQAGRLPSDDSVRVLIREVIAGDPSLRGPSGVNGADGKDGADGAVGPQGARGDEGPAGKDGSTTCPTGYHFEERRADELVCVKDAAAPPTDQPTQQPTQ